MLLNLTLINNGVQGIPHFVRYGRGNERRELLLDLRVVLQNFLGDFGEFNEVILLAYALLLNLKEFV